jgi:hypothetical protein
MEANDKTLDDVLEGRFIRRTMQIAATDINQAQVKYMGFSNPNWITGRSFQASDSALNYSQFLKHRFVDMKKISKKMKQYKKKSHPIYNRIIWGHYNNIIRELSFGFTEAVKAELKQLEE